MTSTRINDSQSHRPRQGTIYCDNPSKHHHDRSKQKQQKVYNSYPDVHKIVLVSNSVSYRQLREPPPDALGSTHGLRQPRKARPPLQHTAHPTSQALPEPQSVFVVRDPGPFHGWPGGTSDGTPVVQRRQYHTTISKGRLIHTTTNTLKKQIQH